MRQIICPVCATKPSSDHSSEGGLLHCANCGVKWTFIAEELDAQRLYEDETYAVVDNRKSIFERIIFSEARKTLRKAEKILAKNSRKLLDFGSGKGQFLLIAKERNWEVIGIETAADRAQFAREKYQVEVSSAYYESGKVKDGQFDLITLNHVLEHLPNPIKILHNLIEDNLNRNGLIYIEVPRSNSWQAKFSGDHWMHWDIPKHLTHWDEGALLSKLAQLNMAKCADRKFSIHLGVLGMLHALLSFFGFRGNLILNLKRKKSPGLMLSCVALLPFAILIETFACLFNRGGILGVYFVTNAKS